MLTLTEAKGEHVPPQTVRAAAKRGLAMVKNGEAGDGLESATVARARKIAAGEALTDAHVKRMHSFFERHDKTRPDDGGSGKSPWRTAWMLWGGNAGRRWAASVARTLDESEWSLNVGSLVIVPDGDEDDVLILQQPVEPGPRGVEEAAATAKAVALIKDAVKTQPRWPKNAPLGKGGEFMRVGERFNYNGKTYEISSIIDGRVTAQIATGENLPGEIHLSKKEAETKIEPAAPEAYKVSGSKKFVKTSKNQVTIDPFVRPETHDPSLPKPGWLSESEWKRFGAEDQRNLLYLEDRFGKWKPGASKAVIDQLGSQYSSDIRNFVKGALASQYGSSSGGTLNLADVAAKIDPDSPKVLDQVKDYEQAKLLLRDTAEAIQWDLYHRTKSPDVAVFHRGGSSHSSKFFAEKVPVMSAWSWSTSWHVWQGAVVNIVPLSIRHVEMHTHSGGLYTGYHSEYEITTGARMSLENGRAIVSYDKNLPAAVRQYLSSQTESKAPISGKIVTEALAAISDPSHELELPPQPSLLKAKGSGTKTQIEPIPSALGAEITKTGAAAEYLGEQQSLKAMVADGLKPGDFIEGLKGTRYVIVKDDSDSSAGLAYMKVGRAGDPLPEPDADKAYSFSSSYDNDFRRLDAHVDLPKPEAEDGFVPMPETAQKALTPGGEAQMIQNMEPGTLVNVDDGIYEVKSADPTSATLVSVDTGKEFSVNPVFKTEPLNSGVALSFTAKYGQQIVVMRDGVPSVAYYMDPEYDAEGKQTGNILVLFPNGPGPQLVSGTTAYNLPASHYAPDGFEVGDQFSRDGKKWTVTSMLKDGTIRAKPSGGKVVKFAPPYDDVDETTHIRPSDWSLGEPTKAKELAVGDLISGSKVKVRPYRVLEVSEDKKTVKLMNLETGEFTESTGGKSWPRLLTKVSPESETVAEPVIPPVSAADGTIPLGGADPGTDPAVVAANLSVWFQLAEPGATIQVVHDWDPDLPPTAPATMFTKKDDGLWYAPNMVGSGSATGLAPGDLADTLKDWGPEDGSLSLGTKHMSEPAGSGMNLPVEDQAVKAAQLADLPLGATVGGWVATGEWNEWTKNPDGDWYRETADSPVSSATVAGLTKGSVIPLSSAQDDDAITVTDGGEALDALPDGTVVSISGGGDAYLKTSDGLWVKPGGIGEKFSSSSVADAAQGDKWTKVTVVQTPDQKPVVGDTIFATEPLIEDAPQGAVLQDPTGKEWTKDGDEWFDGETKYGNYTMADYDPHVVVKWPADGDGTPKTPGALTQAQFEALPEPEQIAYLDEMPEESVVWDDDGHRWAKDAAGQWVSNTAGGSGATTDTTGLVLNFGPLLAGFADPSKAPAAPSAGEVLTAEQIANAPVNTVVFGPSVSGVGDDYWWKTGTDEWRTGTFGDAYPTEELLAVVDGSSTPFVTDTVGGDPKPGDKVPATDQFVGDAPEGTVLTTLLSGGSEGASWTKLADGSWDSSFNDDDPISSSQMADNALHKVVKWGDGESGLTYSEGDKVKASTAVISGAPVGTKLGVQVAGAITTEWTKQENGNWVAASGITLSSGGMADNADHVVLQWGAAENDTAAEVPPMEKGASFQLPNGNLYRVVTPPTETEVGVFTVIHDGANQPGAYVTLTQVDVEGAVPSNQTVEEVTAEMLPTAYKSGFTPFTYASYGGVYHTKVGDLPVGALFTDKSKKTWMVKQNGSEPIITDGFQNFSVGEYDLVRALGDSVAPNGNVSSGNKVGSADELTAAPVGTKVKFSSPLVADNAVWQKTDDDLWETDFGDGPVEASNADMEAGLGSLSFLKSKAPFVDESPPLTKPVEQAGPNQDVLTPFKYASWGDTKFDKVGTVAVGSEFEDKTKTKFRIVAHVGDVTIYENLATGQQFSTSSENRVRVLSEASANVA